MALPNDSRILYLRARAGLVTEAFVLHGAEASADRHILARHIILFAARDAP